MSIHPIRYFFLPLFLGTLFGRIQAQTNLVYPETTKGNEYSVYFGDTLADPYRWLENDTSEATERWVDNQNKVTFDYLAKLPQRERIRQRLTEIWNFEKYSVPFKKGDYYFFYKNDGIQNQSVLYFQKGLDALPQVLLDPNQLSSDGTVALSGLDVRKDGKYAAFMLSSAGSDWRTIRVMEIETGKYLEDLIEWVKFSGISWYGDGFFYSRFDAPSSGNELSQKNQNHKVYYHQLGVSQANDDLIYSDPVHPDYSFYADVTEDQQYLLIYTSQSTSGNNIIARKLGADQSDFTRLSSGFQSDFELITNQGSTFLFLTNKSAPKYRVIAVDFNQPDSTKWRTIIAEKNAVLESAVSAGGRLVLKYLSDVSNHLQSVALDGSDTRKIAMENLGIIDDISGNKADDFIFVSFTNYTTPATIFKISLNDLTQTVFKRPEVNFNTSELITKQIFYSSADGTKIPMYVTHKKDLVLDGNNPTFLYGYGGFNISVLPSFAPERAVFLENGGVYAVANIRGGGEYGKDWHKSGTQLQKQNVFDDFIAAAEYLIQMKYTNPSKLAVHGRSNGGLLVGAVMTQRPDLFKVALPKVGVLDMLRYHQFTIGYAWATDYGTSDEERHYRNLVRYSPLHNVKSVAYPATMIMTADHDDRVVPAHSFKFAAELQSKQKGANPVLIRIDKKAGHGSGKPVSKQIEEFADTWAFVFHHLGMSIK